MTDITYQFESKGLSESQSLMVVDFQGIEGISKLYEYQINLKSAASEIEIDQLLKNQCLLTFKIGNQQRKVHGILSHFQQLHQVGEYTLYHAVLVPRIWQLSLFHVNEVYLDLDIQKIIKMIMEEAGFSALDYDFKLTDSYDSWPFRCQFGETHLQFLLRLMEHLGIYFYFEQGDDAEKVIFSDNKQTQEKMERPAVNFTNSFGLDSGFEKRKVHSFICQKKRVPKKIVLKDYNYDKPSVDIEGEAAVDKNGIGEVFLYGENFETPEEGKKLANIRAEEIMCGKEVFYAEGLVGGMEPGYLFELKDHFRNSFNQDYLLLSIEHKGVHPSHLTEQSEDDVVYSNNLTAIAAEVQFRPPRETPKPRFYGTINALVDSEQDGKYAEMDETGRYKVIIPFDRVKSRDAGKASHWLRMAQPFSGSSEGLCFPLRKGTEVLLTFINGDPDKPVISAAVPNAANPSMINNKNQTNNVIRTSSGNLIELEDKEGSSRIKFATPHNDTYLHLGAANAPGDGLVALTKGIHRMEVSGGEQKTIVAKSKTTPYVQNPATDAEQVYGTNTSKDLINEQALHAFQTRNANGKSTGTMTNTNEISGDYIIERRYGDKYLWKDSNEHIEHEGIQFTYGGVWEVYDKNVAGTDAEKLLNKMKGYTPAGITEYGGGTINKGTYSNTWEKLMGCGEVTLRQLDTFNAQNGNIYDFGGYWKYNLGNSYEENFMGQTGITLNDSNLSEDKAKKGGPEPGGVEGKELTFSDNNVWISKTIGGKAYDYTKDKQTIEVEYETKEESISYRKKEYEYSYGGRTEVYKYAGDTHNKTYKSISQSGKTEEWKWDRVSGAPLSYQFSDWWGVGGNVFNFSTHWGIKQNIEIFAAQSTSISVSAAAKINISAEGSLFFKFTGGVGFGIDIEANVGGKYEANLISGQHGFKSMGFQAQKEAALKADIKSLYLEKKLGWITQNNLDIRSEKLTLRTQALGLDSGIYMMGF